jgi:hypothetical protein
MKTYEQAIEEAAELGREIGRNAAEWYAQGAWGSRATRCENQAAERFLESWEAGDALPEPPNLSGEWAGDETPVSLMARIFGPNWETDEDEENGSVWEMQDDVCGAWTGGAQTAFYDGLIDSANAILS